ncbi:MAG TPA: hypothetical protein VMG30_10845 [Acidobacteriota bacterium]|nr:hypothetical protein [Acidobacteriota bacterium]
MRFLFPLLCVLLTAGCGGRSISNTHARDAILEQPQSALEKEDVAVVKIIQVSGSEAIAETQLKTAFRLEKVNGKWVVREVRIGHNQWEKVDNLGKALSAVKTEDTRKMLDQIAEGIRKYREADGNLPPFKDYIALSDLLTPKYLTPLIRLDSWGQPLEATHPDPNTILLRSAGPDGRFGTPDDIRSTVTR